MATIFADVQQIRDARAQPHSPVIEECENGHGRHRKKLGHPRSRRHAEILRETDRKQRDGSPGLDERVSESVQKSRERTKGFLQKDIFRPSFGKHCAELPVGERGPPSSSAPL